MYGVVIFDDVDDESGWASIAGGESAHIESTADLPYGVYWWCNRGSENMKGFLPGFKHHNYLTPTMVELHVELGILDEDISVKTEMTSKIFSRVMNMARKYYGVMSPQKNTLSEDIGSELLIREKLPEQYIHDALREAHCTWVESTKIELPDGIEVHTLTLPRLIHAINVLNSPVPTSNKWEKAVNPKGIPPNEGDPSVQMDWVFTRKRPMLAKVSIKDVNPKISSLIPYFEKEDRQYWMTHSEILTMSRFSNIKLETVHFCEDAYGSMKTNHKFNTGGFLSPFSISAGILAANFLVTVTNPQNNGKVEPGRNAEIYTPQAVWLASADRNITFASAVLVQSCNFDVISYGQGKIRVACKPDHLIELRNTASKLGLEVALNMTRFQEENESVDE